MSFLTRFSLVGVVATLVVAVVMAWALSVVLTDNAIRQTADATAHHVAAAIEESLTSADLSRPFADDLVEEMDAVLVGALAQSGIVRVKLWNRDGVVLYSDDRSLIGRSFPVEHHLSAAFAGEIEAEMTDLSAAENVQERDRYDSLLEVYAPVRIGGGDVDAVYEVYRETTSLEASIDRVRTMVWFGVLGGFLVVYLALFGIARAASLTLVRQEHETKERLRESLLINSILRIPVRDTAPGDVLASVCDEVGRVFDATCTPARIEGAIDGTAWLPEDACAILPDPRSNGAGAHGDLTPIVLDADGPATAPRVRTALEDRGVTSALLLPVPVRDSTGENLLIGSTRSRGWSEADLRTASSVARAAAATLDKSLLLSDLRRSNEELGLAYESTIEGWARALDMRDRETEGHSRRVTELTLDLMRAAGTGEEALEHARRGALLHDIGKMGVPDSILQKPGPLTDEEWVVMRLHPVHALTMLGPIEYLRPAIAIPYGHHERWDGTGYPLGIAGEMIPFAARVFAIVDIWDALRSDRPYRAAWSEEKVLDYLPTLAGTHLDPDVVALFLELVDNDFAFAATSARAD